MPQVIVGIAAIGAGAVIGGGLSAAVAAGGFAGGLISLGTSLVISGASQKLRGASNRPSIDPRTSTLRAPVRPRELVYGRSRKGGTVVFIWQSSNNRYTHLILTVAAHRVRSIGAVYFNGERATDADGAAIGRWRGKLDVRKRLGGANQSAFKLIDGFIEGPFGIPLEDPVSEEASGWTSSHRLRGCAALYLRLRRDADAYPTGIPTISVDIEGKDDILDPRTGQRGYSTNPALCVADYMSLDPIGIGAQIGAPDGIHEPTLIEAANICDEMVPRPGGGTERRYTCNGVVTLDETPKTIIEAMLTSMAGHAVDRSGGWRIHAGAFRLPTVELTGDDARDGGLTLATRVSRSANFNGVRGQFISPENDWQPDDYPAYASEVYLAEDGGQRVWEDNPLPFTIFASTAQRLAKIKLERARRQQSLRFAGKLAAYRAAAGETVTLDYPRWGFIDKPFEIPQMTLSLEGNQLVTELALRETSPLVYDWRADEERIYNAAPRSVLPSAFDVAPPGTPQLSTDLYTTRQGTGVRVLISAEWLAAQTGIVTIYEVEARRHRDLEGAPTGDDWLMITRTGDTRIEIRDVQTGFWQVRVRAISLLGVTSEWLSAEIEVQGLLAPPSPIEGLTLQTAGGLAILKWTPVADLDVRIGGRVLIRHSGSPTPSWANSVTLDEVAGANAIAVVPLKPGTYLVRARDNSGIMGPLQLVATEGAQALEFAAVDSLVADPTFSGPKTNVEISQSALILTDVAQDGLYEFAAGMHFGSIRRVRLRSEIDLSAFGLHDTIDERLDPIDEWPDFDGVEGAEVDVIVEARLTDDDPALSPVWSEWSRIDSAEVQCRAVEARARLISQSADWNPFVTRLRLHADEVSNGSGPVQP